ncbi:HAD family phosphatase [Gemella sp. GH3]|uniref:HAD family hydrolase n=1 Tax=unclassified Gemella TaxID=2624949 RepID=UPI0015D0544C|nr:MULTISPECIES: HAD family phosphatase [unclassified Gemella]MBF0713732.1 HAD family phosphatase [Gemella sp. GH3.1]NYS50684.1 HAD family phosphatase [Gemella sp. GH3]
MIKAVLFDMDGLMFDTESLSTNAFIEMAKKQGYNMTREETHLVLGFKKEAIYDFYENYFSNKNIDGRKLVDDHYNKIEEVLFTIGPDKMPYLEELLIYLKDNNYKIAVASSSDLEHINNNLKKNELEGYIDVIASGEEVIKGKPAPDIFLLASERLNISPSNCLVLEDSKFGIQAAYTANMKSIMIPDSIQPDEDTKLKATKILDNLGEVIEFLNKEN